MGDRRKICPQLDSRVGRALDFGMRVEVQALAPPPGCEAQCCVAARVQSTERAGSSHKMY